jgi:hypothetical protein
MLSISLQSTKQCRVVKSSLCKEQQGVPQRGTCVKVVCSLNCAVGVLCVAIVVGPCVCERGGGGSRTQTCCAAVPPTGATPPPPQLRPPPQPCPPPPTACAEQGAQGGGGQGARGPGGQKNAMRLLCCGERCAGSCVWECGGWGDRGRARCACTVSFARLVCGVLPARGATEERGPYACVYGWGVNAAGCVVSDTEPGRGHQRATGPVMFCVCVVVVVVRGCVLCARGTV